MTKSLEMKFDAERIARALQAYEGRAHGGLRSAAHAGARVLYDEMKSRAPVSPVPTRIRGKEYPPGLLRDSIYRVFSVDLSGPFRVTYHVGPNKSKAGHWSWVEHGHWTTREKRFRKDSFNPVQAFGWVPAQPYIRPTWDSKGQAAVEAMRKRLAYHMKNAGSGDASLGSGGINAGAES